ncbi:hypothetical protein N658DRAFT_329313 [Parathielavia hyrcaniae]|uniref:Uncharacterized protein n=1 Tax=Parathielavia hyrcaniae TaxID=113614 RepID=A0AAN6Q4X8_9PEZI|nr:hypothetical protein N658DRAFT_329313 [Parathielavia hyrcaniae]
MLSEDDVDMVIIHSAETASTPLVAEADGKSSASDHLQSQSNFSLSLPHPGMPSTEAHDDETGFGLSGGGSATSVSHDDTAAAATAAAADPLSGNWSALGSDGTYSWTSEPTQEQRTDMSCRHGNSSSHGRSSCPDSLLPSQSDAVPRGGRCKGEGKANKKQNKARRQLLWGDEEPYPYPPRRNRRFSGSGDMDASAAVPRGTGV